MQNHMKLRMCHHRILVKAVLLDICFYNINMNLSKYRMADNISILSIFPSKSKNQHICFHGNHANHIGVGVVSFADS